MNMHSIATASEIREVNVALRSKTRLKRTFTMKIGTETVRYWRVVAPETHPQYHSDLSLEGLQDWNIIGGEK